MPADVRLDLVVVAVLGLTGAVCFFAYRSWRRRLSRAVGYSSFALCVGAVGYPLFLLGVACLRPQVDCIPDRIVPHSLDGPAWAVLRFFQRMLRIGRAR